MAYVKTTWEDRVVERPRTYTVTTNADGSITLTPAEGTVITTGTPVNADNLNKVEAGLETVDLYKVGKTGDTGAANVPAGTTAQRPASPIEGMIRYNSTTGSFEGYSNGSWSPIAGAHHSIYRGKYLGSSVTTAQYAEISAGTFNDLYIGDYWTIGGINYRIADFNYYYGGAIASTNHVVIVPDTSLYTAKMNDTAVTTGAYVGSKMRTTYLASAISTIETAFSGHVMTFNQLLANATSSGQSSGWAWTSGSVELMNEVMIYGSKVWGGLNNGNDTGSSMSQLSLFSLDKSKISIGVNYWLRDVCTSEFFALAGANAGVGSAIDPYGVRPSFVIVG